jgi:hypothetical protein
MIDAVIIRVEMKARESTSWELLGTYTAHDAAELASLRELFRRHVTPYDALKELQPGTLIYDLLDVCRLERHEVRIAFVEDH